MKSKVFFLLTVFAKGILMVTFGSSICHANNLKHATANVYPALPMVSASGKNNIQISSNIARVVNFDEQINSLAFSPGGKYLVAGDSGGNINIWEPVTGVLSGRVIGHGEEHVNSLVFHPDGKHFASGADTIKIWNLETREIAKTIHPWKDQDDSGVTIHKLKYTPDGSKLIAVFTGDSDAITRIGVFDTKTDHTSHYIELDSDLDQSLPRQLYTNPVGDTLVIVFTNKQKLVVASLLSDKTKTLTLTVYDAAFSPGGTYLASLTRKGCQILDMQTMKMLQFKEGELGAFLQKNGISCTLYPHLNKTQRAFKEFIFNKDKFRYDDIIFHPDGKWAALPAPVYGNYLELWDIEKKEITRSFSYFSTSINNLEFSPDGKILAVAQDHSRLSFWDTQKETLIESIHLETDSATNTTVSQVGYSSDGKKIFSFIYRDKLLQMEAQSKKIEVIKGNGTELFALMPGKTVVAYIDDSGCDDKNQYCLHVWDYQKQKMLFEYSFHSEYSYGAISFSHDGSLLAVSTSYEVLRIWDAREWKQIQQISISGKNVDGYMTLQFGPDKNLLAGYKHGRGIEIRRLKKGLFNKAWEIIQELDGSSFSFSPDGHSMVTGDHMEDTITIWNARTWKEKKTIKLNSNLTALYLKYSPDNQTIAVAMDYGIVRLIDANTGKTIADLIGGPKGHWFRQTPDGRYWYSGSRQMIASDVLTK